MNFSIKLFAVALLIFSHQTFSMDKRGSKVVLLDLSQGDCQVESSDGVWRVQTSGRRELLCRKNSAGHFEILGTLGRFTTKALISIGSNVSSKDRFVLRLTGSKSVEIFDASSNKIRGLAKADADSLLQISELKSAHMSINSETIAVFDSQDKTILVANPLLPKNN